MKYHKYVSSYIAKPYGQPIFCEEATRIELDDDGGGLFVSIKQDNGNGADKISINPDEWPLIKEAVESLLRVIDIIEVTESNRLIELETADVDPDPPE